MNKRGIRKYLIVSRNVLVLSAAFHTLVLLFISFREGSYEVMNVFSILGITYFFPALAKGLSLFILSWMIPAACAVWFIRNTK